MKNKNNRAWPCLILTAMRLPAIAILMFLGAMPAFAQRGATVPWITYEAENMTINGGTVLGPGYAPNTVQAESSGRECVQLNATGQYIQFTNQATANAIVVRYSVPDTATGGGSNYTLSLYTNGIFAEELPMTSMYSWLYGTYGSGTPAFSNIPTNGMPRNFYDEVRAIVPTINPGDVLRLQVGTNDTAPFYDIDLVDLENTSTNSPPPPGTFLSITDYGADPTGTNDSSAALLNCISAAGSSKSVWMPAGNYKISEPINLNSSVTIQGAGMWFTTLVGDPALYGNPANTYTNGGSNRRISIYGNNSNIHLSDFAIIGKLNFRNDNDYNDGIVGHYDTNSTISRLWVEHVKTGAWIWNSKGLVIDSCRFRDTIADGCNINYGMQGCIVTNCTARGTGDDCFAFWPANSPQSNKPGSNVVTHCTGQLNFLANGGSIDGGRANTVQDCLFQDITYGCGVLISSTFPVGTNVFSGTTVAQRCDLIRDGGYDPNFKAWRGAVQICLALTSITNVNLNNLNISNSASDGFDIISPGTNNVTFSNAIMANVDIPSYGLNGLGGYNGIWAKGAGSGNQAAKGILTVSNCTVQGVWATALSVPGIVNSSGSFTFYFWTSPPPQQNINSVTINGDGSATLAYATTPPYPYHVEFSTDLGLQSWTTIMGSSNSATGSTLTFTDSNAITSDMRFYRTASP